MHTPLSRRAWFARSSTAALAVVALAGIPNAKPSDSFPRTEPARMKLSLAAYSFRDFFKDTNAKRAVEPPADKTMTMSSFLDYSADHGCDGAETTSYYFPANTDRAYLLKLKRHAFLRGLAISGGAIGNTFTHPAGPARDKEMALLKKWVDYCAILGAPHIRVFAGTVTKGMTEDQAVANSIETLKEACAYAGEHGVFLGLENHGGIVAEPGPLLHILKSVDSPWLGINLDSGNFQTADPYGDFAKCAPYAVNVQLKTEVHPKGQAQTHSDIKRFIKILANAKYQGYVALEFEEKADPYETIPAVLKEIRAAINAT
jgi:sugar phosphate isomerase/epimerase